MSHSNQPTSTKSGGFLGLIEAIGNRLPDPVSLFIIGAGLVLIGSHVAALSGWTVVNPQTQQTIQATSLLTGEAARQVWLNLVHNFTSFEPLGVVLVAMIGIGLAERCGLLGAILKALVLVAPNWLLTPGVLFAGVMSSFALDAGYVVLPPLAAAVFARVGRSPLVGMAAVVTGVAAGFSANLLITALDPLLQSFTQEAARILDQDYIVDVRCNYYFMIASTFFITLVCWPTTVWIERRYSAEQVKLQIETGTASEPEPGSDSLTVAEKRGLKWAGITLALTLCWIGLLIFAPWGSLYGEMDLVAGKPTPVAVWVRAIVPLLFVVFLLPGIGYGIAAGTIRTDRDAARMMNETMRTMGPYIVMAFFAAQFIQWFQDSNLGTLIALETVLWLRTFELPYAGLLVMIVLMTGLLNLFIGSASAKWAFISTVFVPIFMGLGISPELTQAAYRVGDSITNPIAPLNPYFPVILMFLRKYDPEAGIGSLVALMLPYSFVLFVSWCGLLLLWMYFGLPLGPDQAPLFIEPL